MKLMNILRGLIGEAEVETPGQVMKKAQLAKTRSDMKQLSQRQKQLAQSRKNIRDTMAKRRISKQHADLGAKKAELGLKAAMQQNQVKTKPKTK